MSGFYPSPRTKALHPVFELAMIARDNDEDREKRDERHIPGLVPVLLEKRDGGHGADQENSQAPARESGADLGGTIEHAVDSRQEVGEGSISVRMGV